ncbi:MAG: sugar phosphate isomerase/epimerase family protein [Paracoccaceae bacterium]
MTDFSYQLYSSRNHPPLSSTLRMVADAGYTQVEGYGGLYADDAALSGLARGLKDTGLAMPTGHFGFEMVANDAPRVLRIAKTVGLKGVIVPHIAQDDRPSDAKGWSAYGAALARVGAPYRDAGLFFGYHNHDFEYVPTDGGHLPLDLMLAADDSLVLEFDVAWAVRGNRDPMDTIARHGGRIRAAHVKDIAPAGQCEDEDGWSDVGAGTMPWAALMAALKKAGTAYFVVEHDNPSDDRRFATRSINALKAM